MRFRKIAVQARRTGRRLLSGELHRGRRAVTFRRGFPGRRRLLKVFHDSPAGRAAYETERFAYQRFRNYSWMLQWFEHGHLWFSRRYLPTRCRLDYVVRHLHERERHGLATQALSIVLDLYVEGFAHRDFHTRNLFYCGEQMYLSDFEFLFAFQNGKQPKPSFLQSYDVTGCGLESPGYTGNMGFASVQHPESVSKALEVTLCAAIEGLSEQLREELRAVSRTFATEGRRHWSRTGRIYSSFSLPRLEVRSSESQRESERRFAQLRISHDQLEGRTVLDLGTHAGAMLFSAQQFGPRDCVGVEVDAEKVRVARRIAAFNNLCNVEFRIANIDELTLSDLGGRFDVVMCFALIAHVQDRHRLYRFLGEVTRESLLFEGNRPSDKDEAIKMLARYFRKVQFLGFCDDDIVPANNQRPLLRAWK